MRILVTVVVATMVLASSSVAIGQAWQNKPNLAHRVTKDRRERPGLGIEYSLAAKVKLASRKSSYRLGEMIGFDIAVLNASNKPVFFHKLSGPTMVLKVFDERGAVVGISPRIIALEGIVPEAYSLLGPGEILIGSSQVLTGCNSEELVAFDNARQKLDEDVRRNVAKYDEALFERNLFTDWGDGCLRIQRSGTYTFVVEVSNQHVIVSAREPNIRTAVGVVRSQPFEIHINAE
jgi:hypothetical protein